MTENVALGPLSNNRRITYRWIAVGITSGVFANAAAWFFWPRLTPVAEPIDRLLLAVQCSAGIGIVALIMMQGLWRLPDTPRAEDPFANAESRGWKINQRVYTNTLEQSLIFAPIFLSLSIRMSPNHVHMLPAMMTIWCVGRLLFWAGYRHSLNARVIGMDLTTVTAMLAAVWFILTFFNGSL
jgi:uncharacterized membrane protein YecN with MAPEG domain